jgi:predicted ATPase
MIDKVHIQALKSIKDMAVTCSKINLFVGTNSSGKSTFLQAILLAAQNGIDKMGLNGKLLSLGEYREVRNYYMNNQSIKIEIWRDNRTEPTWIEFIENKENEKYRIVSSEDNDDIIMDMLSGIDSYEDEKTLPLTFDDGFHYLSCHRIGVSDIYAKNMIGNNDFGIDGEYALAYLLKNEMNPLEDKLSVKNERLTNSFLDQVNYWLDYIVGMTLSIKDLKKTNYLQVKYNNNPANTSSEAMFARPVNVGSGVSYLISILITCLASEENDIIVIENPEIHLHPKAQSRLCEFLYFICTANRQLFIETHSDHIFNGIRVGISNKTMDANNITVNFFALNNYETLCNPIKFGEFGKIIGTNNEMDINDLFDQFEIDLDKMIGL